MPDFWNFKANRTDRLTLRYDTPKETETKKGKRWFYTVDVDGADYTMSADMAMHGQIEALEVGRGSVILVTPLGDPWKGCKYMVTVDSPDQDGAPHAAPVTRVSKPTPDERVASYTECLVMAMRVWHSDRIRAGLQKMGLDQASADTRLMALKDVATHLSMGMNKEWAFPPPEPPPQEQPPIRKEDEETDYPF